jgi:hypothetical protein
MAQRRTAGPRRPPARGRRARRRPGRAATAGLGVLAAGLVAAGVLLPELPGSAAVDPSAAVAAVAPVGVDGGGAAAPGGGGTVNTGGLPGSIVVPGPAVPAEPTFVVPAPVVVPRRLPVPFVPRGEPAVTVPPPAACGGYAVPRRIVPGATAGSGSARVTWQSDPHPDVTGYRVRAVSQTLVAGLQPDPVTVAVAQPGGCGPVTATVGGLTSGSWYVFWLEEAQRDATDGTTRYVQVGSSDPVRIG